MQQDVVHALVNHRGAHFAVVQVKDHIVLNSTEADELLSALLPIYRQPLALMGERNGRTFGNPNVVRFLQTILPQQLPWARGRIELPIRATHPTEKSRKPLPSVDWIGASGNAYTYFIHNLSNFPTFAADGNYIYAYQTGDGWVPIYIGQGDLADRIGPSHHKWNCIISKRATHVHTHRNGLESSRLSEESDLLAAWPVAYAPAGCNEVRGG